MIDETMNRRAWLQKYEHLISGFAGGVVSTVVCHPMDLLRIRYSGEFSVSLLLANLYYSRKAIISADEGGSFRPRYNSYIHATKSIVRVEGIRGLYQGLTPNVVGAALAWGLYMEWYH
ncbi:hypothetical protein DICVIV_07746 [Dictyocaulus viviparus]|uniref:Uncharacterized protein n=1 Tax=Dictyocaulus viviparus TaxID=29172 RepID=A0A0D8XNU2_DICVI|nr:hypothetical protein DICVIV_07746 [Dictyocaulus viviparus]